MEYFKVQAMTSSSQTGAFCAQYANHQVRTSAFVMSNQSSTRFEDAVNGMQNRKRKNGKPVRRAFYSYSSVFKSTLTSSYHFSVKNNSHSDHFDLSLASHP